MGYAYYLLADGREAGYAITAECEFVGCSASIDRGMGFLCGKWPNVAHLDYDGGGCKGYFCSDHRPANVHSCSRPPCRNEDCEEVGTVLYGIEEFLCPTHSEEWDEEDF